MARRRSRPRSNRPASTQQLVVKRLLPLAITAIVAIVGYAQRNNSTTTATPKAPSGKSAQSPSAATADAPGGSSEVVLTDVNRSVGFKTQQRLDDHYIKHGREFGDISKQQYLEMAQELRDAPLSNNIIEARQVRGNLARFDKTSGAFLAYSDNLVIQTFFRPNDGESYFRRAVKANK